MKSAPSNDAAISAPKGRPARDLQLQARGGVVCKLRAQRLDRTRRFGVALTDVDRRNEHCRLAVVAEHRFGSAGGLLGGAGGVGCVVWCFRAVRIVRLEKDRRQRPQRLRVCRGEFAAVAARSDNKHRLLIGSGEFVEQLGGFCRLGGCWRLRVAGRGFGATERTEQRDHDKQPDRERHPRPPSRGQQICEVGASGVSSHTSTSAAARMEGIAQAGESKISLSADALCGHAILRRGSRTARRQPSRGRGAASL